MVVADSAAEAEAAWQQLDAAWHEAFRQAFDAFRTGNIAVGACVTDPDGNIVTTSRNRTFDTTAPAGETYGSSIAHAEINVLARLAFRRPRDLVLTTTLQPCLQCAAAIRIAPIARVRVAGPDPVWDGCHDFSPLTPWLNRRPPTPLEGPRHDEIGAFGALLARFGPGHKAPLEAALREHGHGTIVDLAYELEGQGQATHLANMDPAAAFTYLWPRLRNLHKPSPASSSPA
jgi:tRNA(Arg) A34 adenosine deaminase TadA